MPGTLKNTSGFGIQRIDMPGPAECLGFRFRVGKSLYGGGSVGGGYACRTSFQFVHGHGEGRTEHGSVVRHLVHQIQFGATLLGYRTTENTASVL